MLQNDRSGRCGFIEPREVVLMCPPPGQATIRKADGSTVTMADELEGEGLNRAGFLQSNRKLTYHKRGWGLTIEIIRTPALGFLKMPYRGKSVLTSEPKRVSLGQLAKYCDLSKSTVSRILNHRSGEFPIRPETMAQVFQAAQKLGYRRNRLARAVASQRTHLVGLSLPTLPECHMQAEPFVTPVSHLFISAVFAHPLFASYDLVIHKRDKDSDMLNMEDLLDGMLYVDPEGKSGEPLRKVLRSFPVVVMGTIPNSASWLVTVDVNNRSVGSLAARHLRDQGAEELLILIPATYSQFGCFQQREEGCMGEAQNIFQSARRPVSLRVGDDTESIRQAIAPHLGSGRKLGIFLTDDRHCAPLLLALSQLGVRLPEDALLVSMGIEGHGQSSQSLVTTIDIPLYEIGAKATDLLLRVLTGEKTYQPAAHVVPEKLTVRSSTAV